MSSLQCKIPTRAKYSTRYRCAACASMSLKVMRAPRVQTTDYFGAAMPAKPLVHSHGLHTPIPLLSPPRHPASKWQPTLPEWSDGLSRSSPHRRCRLKQFWTGNHNLPYSFTQLWERVQHDMNHGGGEMPFYSCWTLFLQIFRTKVSWRKHGSLDKGEEPFPLRAGASTSSSVSCCETLATFWRSCHLTWLPMNYRCWFSAFRARLHKPEPPFLKTSPNVCFAFNCVSSKGQCGLCHLVWGEGVIYFC